MCTHYRYFNTSLLLPGFYCLQSWDWLWGTIKTNGGEGIVRYKWLFWQKILNFACLTWEREGFRMAIYVFFQKKKKYQEWRKSKDTYYYQRGKGMGRQIISTFLVICGLCVVCCYIYQIRLHQGFFPVPRFSESGRDRFFSFLGAFFISIICSSWSLSL